MYQTRDEKRTERFTEIRTVYTDLKDLRLSNSTSSENLASSICSQAKKPCVYLISKWFLVIMAILSCFLPVFHYVTMIATVFDFVTPLKSHLSDLPDLPHRLIVKIGVTQGCYGDYSSWQHKDLHHSLIGHYIPACAPCLLCVSHCPLKSHINTLYRYMRD